MTFPSTGLVGDPDTERALNDIRKRFPLSFADLSNLSSGNILVGNSTNRPTGVAMSGDVTISNAGVTAIGTGKVTSAMVLNGTLVDADLAANTLSAALPSWGTYYAHPMAGSSASTASGFANIIFQAQVQVLSKCTLTGVAYWVGGTSNGNVRSALYDSGGNRVIDCTATIAQAAINTFQKVPFDGGGYAAVPGTYFACILFSSATATATLGRGMAPAAASVLGGFATGTTIAVPTTAAVSALAATTY